MKNKCKDCGKCCLETEMMLSKDDIHLILRHSTNNLKREDFTIKIQGYFQLKNINGHCIFFDYSNKTCRIYPFRPQGCRFYPLIYYKDTQSCLFDEDCPRKNLFYKSNHEFEKICKRLKKYVREKLKINS
ncbi:MAG: YkgJ family cysteine cluster protein [Promethearchaeota archaeon]|nr:MAG: YkgJ family cysteine cluster protein [Candidatus Lokiarchaeota archaeon]